MLPMAGKLWLSPLANFYNKPDERYWPTGDHGHEWQDDYHHVD